MTDEFDDEVLRDALDGRSGGPVDAGRGRQAIVDRAARIRTRRTAVAGGSAAVVMIGGLVAVASWRDEPVAVSELPTPSVEVASTSTTSSPASGAPTTAVAGGEVGSTVVVTTTVPGVSPTVSAPVPSTSTTSLPWVSLPPPSQGSDTTVPRTTAPPTTVAPPTTAPPPTTTTPPTTTSVPADAPFTRTYESSGGSITVDWDGSSLSLLAVSPDPGFAAEIEDESASRVRVRFRGEPDDSRIDIRADDGRVESEIT